MILGLFRRRDDRKADDLYAAVVAHARNPVFYTDFAVPDSVEGRFELIVAHCGLLVARFTGAGEPHAGFGRRLAEAFFADMDRNLREMGIGDLTVPKRMKKIAGAFYGRTEALQAALADADPAASAEVVRRNVYDGAAPAGAAEALAGYLHAAALHLAAADLDTLKVDPAPFPDPAGPQTGRLSA